MCEVRPGPRCNDKCEILFTRQAALAEAKANHAADSYEVFYAEAAVASAQDLYDTTPRGIGELEERLANADYTTDEERIALETRSNKGKLTRQLQIEALKEVRNGRAEAVGTIAAELEDFLSPEEVKSLVEASREYYEGWALKYPNKPVEQVKDSKYQAYINGLEEQLKEKYNGKLPENVTEALALMRTLPAPNETTMKAYDYMPKAIERSKTAVNFEIRKISGMQNVKKGVAQAYYEAYREQYNKEYAHLPEGERPDVPASWIRGEFANTGYTQDPSSQFAPRDPASLYAAYRLRVDESAVPDFLKINRQIASIDLETAGPEGRDGFEPQNGRIIEVGIVTYNKKGKELGILEQLIKPEESFLEAYGTGAEHVHQISVDMLQDSPAWGQVHANVLRDLEGKTMLAQNAAFEYKWLKHHLPGFNEDSELGIIDTMDMARKHLDIPNHKLKTICGSLDEPYTNGHRAFHDAEVAAQAYFKMVKKIQKTWNSKPARKNAKPLNDVKLNSRWDSYVKKVS